MLYKWTKKTPYRDDYGPGTARDHVLVEATSIEDARAQVRAWNAQNDALGHGVNHALDFVQETEPTIVTGVLVFHEE